MRRKRKAIPLCEQLAAALACLLPAEQRDELRRTRAPAKAVARLFTNHHLDFHAFDGSDKWWNLHPMTKPEHDARFAADVKAIAKVKRIMRREGIDTSQVPAAGRAWFKKARLIRPKAKIAQRRNPWPSRGTRKIAGRSTFGTR